MKGYQSRLYYNSTKLTHYLRGSNVAHDLLEKVRSLARNGCLGSRAGLGAGYQASGFHY